MLTILASCAAFAVLKATFLKIFDSAEERPLKRLRPENRQLRGQGYPLMEHGDGKTRAMRWLRGTLWTMAILCISAIGIQFVGTQVSDSPVKAEILAPPEVRQILRRSCYDCHSNETKLTWYDRLAPASWFVAQDVKAARRHINFSEIGELPVAAQRLILFQAANEIQLGAMPLRSYGVLHPQAAVTAEQLAVLRAYLSSQGTGEFGALKSTGVSSPVFGNRLGSETPISIRPSPNGIEYIAEYKNWKTISSTDRFDNNTLRVVLGNDIAIRAIANKRINPWPEGTVFAKVDWEKKIDSFGITHTGKFNHVDFMVRDTRRFAATNRWGYARWNGVDLKPYGSNAAFASECADCHDAVRRNDYVFTTPIGRRR